MVLEREPRRDPGDAEGNGELVVDRVGDGEGARSVDQRALRPRAEWRNACSAVDATAIVERPYALQADDRRDGRLAELARREADIDRVDAREGDVEDDVAVAGDGIVERADLGVGADAMENRGAHGRGYVLVTLEPRDRRRSSRSTRDRRAYRASLDHRTAAFARASLPVRTSKAI